METIEIIVNGTEYTLTDSYNAGDIAFIQQSDFVYTLSGDEESLDAADEIVKEQPDAVMLYTDCGTCLIFSNYEIEEEDLEIIQFDYEINWDFAARESGANGVYGEEE
jgi:hypothetical protein